LQTFAVLAKAGFHRYSTYRQATLAGIFTNVVFGFMRCFVLLAVAAGAGGSVAGYRGSQLVTYVWIGQGMISVVGLWGDTELASRIRTGDVVADLLRPIHPIASYFAVDLGRALFAVVTRMAVPIVVGMLAFDFYVPHAAATYPLFVASLVVATVLSFGCRYIVNAAAFWIMDGRGPQIAWQLAATLLGGLYFPLHFLPPAVVTWLWLATPFPSLLQAPLDIASGRASTPLALGYLGVAVAWTVAVFALAALVQRRAERRLVVQGG
jgi:ABC-2 type transport system permease protein